MAKSQIVNYDDDSKMIHWFYHRHEDDKRVDVKESVYSFLDEVLMHCPEKISRWCDTMVFIQTNQKRHITGWPNC